MNKKEKIIAISLLLILAILINLSSCFKMGFGFYTIYYLIYSLVPYFIFSFITLNINSRAVVYITSIFMLAIDSLIKIDIGAELINYSPDVLYSWILLAPLLLISLIFIVFAVLILIIWFCQKKGITMLNIKLKPSELIRFKDHELGNFVYVVIALGFIINFQNVIVLFTTILNSVINFTGFENLFSKDILLTIFGVSISLLPYLIFLLISYFLNCKWASFLVGFMTIIFDIYLKIISETYFSSIFDFGNKTAESVYSILNPFTFIMFVPVAFGIVIFGSRLLERK